MRNMARYGNTDVELDLDTIDQTPTASGDYPRGRGGNKK
jgi:hypothetical protein